MKIFLSFSLLLLTLVPGILSATALLRETSTAQNQVAAPPDGELVYAVNEEGTVRAFVGRYGLAMPVVDPDAIRLTACTPFPAAQLDIGSTGSVTELENGEAVYGVGVITITQIHKIAIGNVEYEAYAPSGSLSPPSATVTVSIEGNVATLNVTAGQITRLAVTPSVGLREVDLCQRDVIVKDSLGWVNLSRLRQSAVEHFNGRTAEYWADFVATKPVNLNGQAIIVDQQAGSAITPAGNGLTLYAGRRPAIAAAATITANDAVSGSITVTRLDVGSETVTLTAQLSGIDAEAVELQYTPTLTPTNWLALTPLSRTLEGDILTLTAPRHGGKSGFYRLVAGDTVSLLISVMGDLDVQGKLILRSPSGKRFAVSVADDGTLSAAEIAP